MANQDVTINLSGAPVGSGPYLFVDGSGRYWGRTQKNSFRTIQKAVNAARSGATIYVAPGAYDETVTIGRSGLSNVTIVGTGGRGAAFIEPSTEDAGGMIVHADDVTLINIGVAAEDDTSAAALTVTGARFRASGCKFEGGAKQLVLGPGTDAQISADSRGKGADTLFEDCEFCWGTNGVVLTASDYGAVTQAVFRQCRFHNLSAASFEETGGSAAVRFQNVQIVDCTFDTAADGTAPTKWISLNDDNANTGLVARCIFPTAINSGKNLVSTKMLWASNFHSGGISTAQPS